MIVYNNFPQCMGNQFLILIFKIMYLRMHVSTYNMYVRITDSNNIAVIK